MNKLTENLRGVGFDLDRTLYSPNPNDDDTTTYFCKAIAKELGIEPQEVIDYWEKNFPRYNNTPETIKRFSEGRLDDKKIEDIFLDTMDANEQIDYSQIDPELVEVMEDLKSKYSLFLVTANRKENALRKLSAAGLDESLFNPVIYRPKTKIEGFRQVAQNLRVPFSQLMYVGDEEQTDIVPANSLGMLTARVNNVEDTQSSATFQLRTPKDLRGILLEQS